MIRLIRYLGSSLRARFAVGMVLLAVLTIGMSAWAFVFLGEVGGSYQRIVNRALDDMVPVSRLQQLAYSSSQPVHNYLLDGDPVWAQAYGRVSMEIDGLFARYARHGNLPDAEKPGNQQARADAAVLRVERQMMAIAVAEWKTANNEAESLFADGVSMTPAARIARMNKFDRHVGHTVQVLGRLYDLIETRVHDEWVRTRASQEQDLSVVMGLLWGSLALLGIMGFMLMRSVVVPLGSLQQAAARYAKGDFAVPVDTTRRDELGQLAAAFHRMGEDLSRTHEQLRYLSAHDELTGLWNRRAFHEQLLDETNRGERFASGFAVVILDADHFKQVNDNFGHQAGDAALKWLAAAIRREIRAVDRAARLGGEEFAVLLPGTGVEGATALAERIRLSMQEHPVEVEGDSIPLTVSAGVAAYPAHGATINAVMAAADRALYVAKDSGRNRVAVSS
ncbi:MAG: diguanylate cyclase [Nitrospirota bacterium]|nr:diguanylate cyclase [Nitrospirota bacterium]